MCVCGAPVFFLASRLAIALSIFLYISVSNLSHITIRVNERSAQGLGDASLRG